MTTQCVLFTNSKVRQIERSVLADDIFNMDFYLENLSQALVSESKPKEHIHFFHNAENFSANSKALVCVDCSMEKC